MKYRLSVCVLALFAAACQPKVETAAPSHGTEAKAKRMPLPDCAMVGAEDVTAGWTHKDCRLMSSDRVGLAFEVRYSAPVDAQDQTITVQVVATGDALLQTITETILSNISDPSLQDIDADGRDELLIPLDTGNVNTTWAVWRATGAATHYKRLEELSGIGIGKTDDGYIVSSARSSASSWSLSYYKFDGEDLEPVANIDISATDEDTDGKVTGTTCVVRDAGGLDDVGLDPKAAEIKFCANPAASAIFK